MIAIALLVMCASCAVSTEEVERREQREAEIGEIISLSATDADGNPSLKRCLRDEEYRSFRALDGRHLLFKGNQGRLWINTLKSHCPDLRLDDVLYVRVASRRRMCELDTLWFWHRKTWHSPGMTCALGEFRPVSEEQVAEIRAVLRR